MFEIKYGDSYIFDSYDDLSQVSDIQISGSTNACTYLDFVMGPNHPLYNVIQKKDLSAKVTAYLDGYLMFSGYVYDTGDDMDKLRSMSCKGDLSYLGDTRVRPYSTVPGESTNVAPYTVDGYFRWLIEEHNAHCDSTKAFEIGTNQGDQLEENNYIYRSSEQYPATDQEIQDKILDSLGGYLFVTYGPGDNRTINLLSECVDVNAQIIDFGTNIVDFVKNESTEELYTAIIPVGGTPDATDSNPDPKPTTIESIPDGPLNSDTNFIVDGDRIYNKAAVERYGIRELYWSESDATAPYNLANAAVKALKKYIDPKTSIEIRAVDLALIRKDSTPLMPGQLVRVRSRPHSFDSYLLVSSYTFNVDNPGNSQYTLGTTYDSLTGESNKKINELNKGINSSLDSVSRLDTATKNNATQITEVGESVTNALDTANDAASKADDAIAKAEAAVVSTVEEFYQSDNPNHLDGGRWESTNTWVDGKYTFRRTLVTYGDGTMIYTPDQNGICISGNTGDPGENGSPGEPGPQGPPGEPGEKGANGTMLYGNSSTAADVAVKVAEVEGFELEAGATISIAFDSANTASGIKLDINGTGEKPVVTNGVNQAYWSDGQTVIFVYDGVNYNVASSPVYADTVTVGNGSSKNVFIDKDGISLKTGRRIIAKFKDHSISLGINDKDAAIDLADGSLTIKTNEIEQGGAGSTWYDKLGVISFNNMFNRIEAYNGDLAVHSSNAMYIESGQGSSSDYRYNSINLTDDRIAINSGLIGSEQIMFDNRIQWGFGYDHDILCLDKDSSTFGSKYGYRKILPFKATALPSTNQSFTSYTMVDEDSQYIVGAIGNERFANGTIGTYFKAAARPSASQEYANLIECLVARNNVKTYAVSDPAAFRTAIGVTNKVLANPDGWYMSASQTATLSQSVSSQATGIVLEWSVYTPSTGVAENYGFSFTFIPKQFVASHNGSGVCCEMKSADGTITGHKYVYVSDTQVTGNAVNTNTNNNRFVLRRVIGV